MRGEVRLAVDLLQTLTAALGRGEPVVLVTVERALGSTPREAGAAMLVSASEATGTVGGGALEMEAILEARRMLAAGDAASMLDIPLGPSLGQCCGGRVVLSLERADRSLAQRLSAKARERRLLWPTVLVFGAGHTGQALARALAPLPLRTRVVDTRADRLAALPEGVERTLSAMPESEVDRAPAGTAYVVMTHDHALDFLIAARALERGDAAYTGMIGSSTKLEKFRRHLAGTGSSANAEALTLPIGGTHVRDKRPEIIAAMTAAEILARLCALDKLCAGFAPASRRCNNGEPGSSREDMAPGTALHAASS